MINLSLWIRRPDLIGSRLKYWWYTRTNPDAPWLCPSSVSFLEGFLQRDMRMVEFGSGRSTAWFAERVGRLTSVEHDANWAIQVRESLASKCLCVDYRVVAIEHSSTEPEQETYDPMPAYVRVLEDFAKESLDLVVVDGHYRTHCVQAAVSRLKRGGVILVDDAQRWSHRTGPFFTLADWNIVNDSSNGIKRAVAWQKPL